MLTTQSIISSGVQESVASSRRGPWDYREDYVKTIWGWFPLFQEDEREAESAAMDKSEVA